MVKNSKSNRVLTILPAWKEMSKDLLHKANREVQKAQESISDSCNQVYIVYPQGEKLTKHITIKLEGGSENEEIKMIPYSFNFCNRQIDKNRISSKEL